MYVTMLRPSTSKEAIANQLSKALKVQPTDFDCVKLLAKDHTSPSPTFISFKVGMADDLLLKSMEPSIWPPGVAFRVTENYSSCILIFIFFVLFFLFNAHPINKRLFEN
jgi:hypothetical protein